MTDKDDQSRDLLSQPEDQNDSNSEDVGRELTELAELVEQKRKEVESWRKRVSDLAKDYADWGLDVETGLESAGDDDEIDIKSEADIDTETHDHFDDQD